MGLIRSDYEVCGGVKVGLGFTDSVELWGLCLSILQPGRHIDVLNKLHAGPITIV